MQTFLIVVAGVVVGLVLFVFLAWMWLKRKLRGLGQALCSLAHGAITPFRITLRSAGSDPWRDAAGVQAGSADFEALGYRRVGDFEIPEMPNVALRALWHPSEGSYAVIYDHEQAGVYADVVRDFLDGTHLTVSCCRETGMDRPDDAPLIRVEVELSDPQAARLLHERLVAEARGREAMPTTIGDFQTAFTEAYAQEADWRIARGGVTAEEVRRAAECGGQPAPEPQAVEMIQAAWRSAIDEFVGEEALGAYLARSAMSPAEWEEKRERVWIAHEHADRAERIEELAWRMAAGRYAQDDDEAMERAFEEAKGRLEALCETGSFRQGVARAVPLMGEKQRLELVESLETPWPADVYLTPPDLD